MTARRLPAGALGLSVVLTQLAGCGGTVEQPASGPAEPWPQRPVVRLSFDVASDLHTVDGVEPVLFTPDAPACELVFRSWPNEPTIAATGGSLVVTAATVDGVPSAPRTQAAGAPPSCPPWPTGWSSPPPCCSATGVRPRCRH